MACAPPTGHAHRFTDAQRLGERAALSPALASAEGKLFAMFRGAAPFDGIWAEAFDGRSWSSQQPMGWSWTSAPPAVAIFHGRPFSAWRGAGDMKGLWYSTYDIARRVWGPSSLIPDVGSEAGPAIAVWHDRLFLLWRGIGADPVLWWSTYEGDRWSPQRPIIGTASRSSPALGASSQTLMLAYSSIEDESVWWSTFDGTAWAAPRRVEGATASGSPALAGSRDEIFLAWRGLEPPMRADAFGESVSPPRKDTAIWWARGDEEGFAGEPRLFPLGSTWASPAIAVLDDDLCFAWNDEAATESVLLASLPIR